MVGKPEAVVVVKSKLSKIEELRREIMKKFDVPIESQRLIYGGKLLSNGYSIFDYNIKLNDVIQLMVKTEIDKPQDKASSSQVQERENEKIEKSNSVSDIKEEVHEDNYIDADDGNYKIGDLVDARDLEGGYWVEGEIIRIVQERRKCQELLSPRESDNIENFSPNVFNVSKSPNLNRSPNFWPSPSDENVHEPFKVTTKKTAAIYYKVELKPKKEYCLCMLQDIRPRARNIVSFDELKLGQIVMVNHNISEPGCKGHWYDVIVRSTSSNKKKLQIIGDLYVGVNSTLPNEQILVHDKIFAIEKLVPLAERTAHDNSLMNAPIEPRTQPLNCTTCQDKDPLCKDCGCYICESKDRPGEIILCDECDQGYHLSCLDPPLSAVPEEDWYCPVCKRDPNEVVAPGAAKQAKKTNKSGRDWGRGMACAGKSKSCPLPSNHFGPIDGLEVGMCWLFRMQVSETGLHRPPVAGIHGRASEGAYSLVLSGGYEDDVDNGNEFTYTGSGGRDLTGNKRTAGQSCDQKLQRENRALARNCAAGEVSEAGGDAGDGWRRGRPVRVLRADKLAKHCPTYAPKQGIRYDGIYKVVRYYPETGLAGFRVWKYLLRRDDPAPAPWEEGAKHFDIVYPPGHLEAVAEKKKALVEKSTGKRKRSPDSTMSPINAKRQPVAQPRRSPKRTMNGSSTSSGASETAMDRSEPSQRTECVSEAEMKLISADTLNQKLWSECLENSKNKSKVVFIENVKRIFMCIICQEVVTNPITTPCLHNFCTSCLRRAMREAAGAGCPCCRGPLEAEPAPPNRPLRAALRAVLPGYGAKSVADYFTASDGR